MYEGNSIVLASTASPASGWVGQGRGDGAPNDGWATEI